MVRMPLTLEHLLILTCDGPIGEIVYTRVLSQEIILLNSEQTAIALLDKRSEKYSDRPAFSAAELCILSAFLLLSSLR